MIRLSWWEERRSSESGIKLEMRIVAFVSTIVMVVGCLLDPQSVQESSADMSEYIVRDLQLIREGGFYPKWSHTKNLIAFNELVEGEAFTPRIPGTYEIFIMKPDGTDIRCLTCSAPSILREYHKGQPFWHPSGEYIVFTAQNEHTQPTQYNLDSFPGILFFAPYQQQI